MYMVDWDKIRALFPVTNNFVYLDSATFSVTSTKAVGAINEFTHSMLFFQEHSWADNKRVETKVEAAKLVGAKKNEIGLGEGATYGLNLFARLISGELREGDSIITADMEFLQSTLPWLSVSKKKGIKIKMVINKNGRYEIDDFRKLIDANTKVISISSVQWNNGFKTDINELGELAESEDVYFIIDAAHHLGAAPIDVHEAKVDFMSSSGHKWLLSPIGTGLFYMSTEMIEYFEPDICGYMGIKPPRGFERMGEYFEIPDSSPMEEFTPLKDNAQKFEVGGTSNYVGAVALTSSLKLFNEIGMDIAAARILQLGDYLIQRLKEIGAQIVSPEDREHRAGITTFKIFEKPEEDKRLQLWLKNKGIYVSMRYTSNVGGIRVSTHIYNNESDIDHLIEAIASYKMGHTD